MATTFYTEEFFNAIADVSERSAHRVVSELFPLLLPKSVVDVGCGTGTWLRAFLAEGVTDITGLDGAYVNRKQLRIPESSFLGSDLTQPVNPGRTFDLAISLEVAEHLPPARSESFVTDLCRLAPIVLFSAAIPGQRGTNHINERWQSYWAQKFAENDFVVVEAFGRRFWEDSQVSSEYAQNMVLYAHSNILPKHPQLLAMSKIPGNRALDVVHPHYWTNIGLKRIVSSLPNALSMAWRRIGRGF